MNPKKLLSHSGIKVVAQVTKEDLVAGLNQDLALEWAALLQYQNHASMIKGLGYESFIKHLKEHAEQEFKHAQLVADRISFLGGKVTLKIGKRFGSTNSKNMLVQDMKAEQAAISNYKIRIKQAEALDDVGTIHLLEKILIEEEEHLNDLLTILGTKNT